MSTNINMFSSIEQAEASCYARPFDMLVIGSGPSGAQAAIYGASEGLKVGVIESGRIGGQIGQTMLLENVLGHPDGITGEQIRRSIKHQILKWNNDLTDSLGYDVSTIIAAKAVAIHPMGSQQEVEVEDPVTGTTCRLLTATVVIASGMSWDNATFDHSIMNNHHFHYGPEKIKSHAQYGRKFLVIGGGNSACQAAVAGAEEADVTLVVRSRLNISEYLRPRILDNASVKVHMPYTVETIQMVAEYANHCDYRATIRNGENNGVSHCDFNELFYVANSKPNNGFVKGSGIDLSSKGQIIVESDGVSTNIPGIFAIGDIRHNAVRRVATALGSGSSVIPYIHKFVDANRVCSVEVCD